MSSSAQEFWDRLPTAEQQRRLAYYDRTARQAHSHCCSVLIGCPLQPTHEARSATGTLLRLEEQHFLITANHVLDGFAKKSEAGPVHFQAGGLVINPWARLVHQDTANDLAVLAIDEKDVPSIGCTPYEPVGSWPPDCPQDHDFVHLCGFAGANRLNGLAGTIENVSLH